MRILVLPSFFFALSPGACLHVVCFPSLTQRQPSVSRLLDNFAFITDPSAFRFVSLLPSRAFSFSRHVNTSCKHLFASYVSLFFSLLFATMVCVPPSMFEDCSHCGLSAAEARRGMFLCSLCVCFVAISVAPLSAVLSIASVLESNCCAMPSLFRRSAKQHDEKILQQRYGAIFL